MDSPTQRKKGESHKRTGKTVLLTPRRNNVIIWNREGTSQNRQEEQTSYGRKKRRDETADRALSRVTRSLGRRRERTSFHAVGGFFANLSWGTSGERGVVHTIKRRQKGGLKI